MKPLILRRALAALAFAGAAFAAHAADFTLAGNLIYNTDVVRFDFTVGPASNVTLWTDSWLAGLHFDPTLALFDAAANLLVIGDDVADPSLLLPGQGGYDGRIDLSLAAGHYVLALTASGNDALGPTFADGFSLAGTTPIPVPEWNQPSYDINANDQKGTAWRVHLDGVNSVAAVPEPGEWALLSLGLAVLAGVGARRRTRGTGTIPGSLTS